MDQVHRTVDGARLLLLLRRCQAGTVILATSLSQRELAEVAPALHVPSPQRSALGPFGADSTGSPLDWLVLEVSHAAFVIRIKAR